MSKFSYGRCTSKCIVKGKNKTPIVEGVDISDPDDAFVLQQGRGICKGLASVWVIAFLNRVNEATDEAKFADWFETARLHATEIKEAGGHIDRHVTQIEAAQVPTGITVHQRLTDTVISEKGFPGTTPWATYCSIWKHDIAFGAGGGATGRFYIMEPNDGLYIYATRDSFVADLSDYVELRRAYKKETPRSTIGLYYCTRTS